MALFGIYLCSIIFCLSNAPVVFTVDHDTDEQSDAAFTTPRFLSQGGEHTVMLGATAKLNCVVTDLGDYAVSWHKLTPKDDQSEMNDSSQNVGQLMEELFLERTSISQNSKLKIEDEDGDSNDYSMTIMDVDGYDSGIYECSISTTPPVVLRHKLNVNVQPSVRIAPESSPYIVEPGFPMTLTCFPSGNPVPRVTWSRLGGPLPDGRESHIGKQLFYDNVNSSHSGTYRCEADNDVKEPSSAQIAVEVHSQDKHGHAPTVTTDRKFVPVNQGDTIRLTCEYSANPSPQIRWLFGNFGMNQQSQKWLNRLSISTIQTSSAKQKFSTTLTLNNIMESDFGEYVCEVHNNLATSLQRIDVSGKPGPPSSFNATVHGDRIDFAWRLESAPDVSGYKLFYRKHNADMSLSIEIPADNGRRLKENEWVAEYSWPLRPHERFPEPDTEYQFSVQGFNQYGDGSLSRTLDIRTPAKFEGDGEKLSDSSADEPKQDDDKLDQLKYQREMSKSINPNGGVARRPLRFLSQAIAMIVLVYFCRFRFGVMAN